MKNQKYYIIKDLFRHWFLTDGGCPEKKAYALQPYVEEYPFFNKLITRFETKEDAEKALFEANSLPHGVVFQIIEVYGVI